MARIVRLSGGQARPWPEELVEALKSAPRCFHADPSDPSFLKLQSLGVRCEPAPDDITGDAVLILPEPPLQELVYVVDRLLGPGGCPWDQEQTHDSLKKYLLEEVYELFDAIGSRSDEAMMEELGDVLLQPLMHAAMKKRDGGYGPQEVAATLVSKLVRRHPHVFGDVSAADSDEVLRNWDRIKAEEKGEKPASRLAGIPSSMPALARAYAVSKRAVRVGFEWSDIDAVFDKLHEEEVELRGAIASGDHEAKMAEVGDLLFTAVNLARWAGVEPEEALRQMLNRFTDRFMHMERHASKALEDLSPEEWDGLWESAKSRLEVGEHQ